MRAVPRFSWLSAPLLSLPLATTLLTGLMPTPPERPVPPPVKAAAERPLRTSEHAYGPHIRQRLTAYRYGTPTTPRPGIVLLHGGYWAEDRDWSGPARTFAARGYAVFDVDYRLNSDATWPAQRTDVVNALTWIRTMANRFSLDPDRLVVFGSSAGGHLATAIGARGRTRATPMAGVVALSPVASPHRAWLDGGAPTATRLQHRLRVEGERLAGCPPHACPRQWHSMSAKNHATPANPGVPILLIHSDDDFVPAAHSHDLASALRDRDVTVLVVPGGSHGGALLGNRAVDRELTAWLRSRAGN